MNNALQETKRGIADSSGKDRRGRRRKCNNQGNSRRPQATEASSTVTRSGKRIKIIIFGQTESEAAAAWVMENCGGGCDCTCCWSVAK